MSRRFTHLHCHSYFSLMEGTAAPEILVPLAKSYGMDSLAITDLNGLYGWVEFVQLCRHYKIRPLCGIDLHAGDGKAVLLARDFKGYERICRIVSDRHLEKDFSLLKSLSEDRDHLAVLSRDLDLLQKLKQLSGPEQLYVEIIPLEENLAHLHFARDESLKPVATNNVYLGFPKDQARRRLLQAIAANDKFSRMGAEPNEGSQRFFCDEAWMQEKLSYAPEAIDNATQLSAELEDRWELGSTIFPPFQEFSDPEAYFTLHWKCHQGALRRYGRITPQVQARLDYELGVIRQKGFTHYFLVVDDIVRQAPRTCGRGSVAASLVSYCLGITHVNPLKYNLFFERFLNPDRKDPPDADIDFPWDERDTILDYVFKKYGPYRAAMVCNHVRFQMPMAVREIAKVQGFADSEITRLTEKWFRFPPKKFPEPWDEIFQMAESLHDQPRYLSVHSGGVIIVPDDLRRYVPLQPAPKGVNIIQWEKDQTEDFGLVKIDLLGNRSLSVVRDALAAVEVHTGRRIDYHDLDPTQDLTTQEMLKRGDTLGVFYIESPATRLLQKKAGVGDYEHLIIHSSIIRPASHRYINEYVERLHGKPYQPLHPLMAEILKESYGLMIYQEDVTKTAMALAGFSAVEGDGLRKTLTKKRPEKWLPEYRERFFEGAMKRGIEPKVIELAWQMIESFAGYSFCKPHSASYAMVSFQAAYLRAHYPAEFIAAVISNGGGFYSTFAYLSEARRMGLEIMPPDINLSELAYQGRGKELRCGLMQLKGVREEWLKSLLRERQARGPFASLEDFLARVKSEQAEMRLLIRAGCFDSISGELNRPQLLWKFLQIHSPAAAHEGFAFGQARPWIPEAQDYSEEQKLQDEIETLSLMLSHHPMSLYQNILEHTEHLPAARMHEAIGQRVRMAGWLITGKVVATKHEESMEFMTFEDLTGIYETTFFPKAYQRNAPLLNQRQPFWLFGKIENDHGGISMNVESIVPIQQSLRSFSRKEIQPRKKTLTGINLTQ